VIGCNLEQLSRVLETMDFIQHDPLGAKTFKKALRVEHHPADARQFAVKIFSVRKILTQASLSDAANTSEPDDGLVLPRPVEQFQPEMPVYHMKTYLQIVAPNAIRSAACISGLAALMR
jgi:hypothetical protein